MAETTFFHHTFPSEGDVTIERTLHLLWPLGFIPVETSDIVRAGCGAVSATDASIKDNSHQPFLILIGGAHWADLYTGWMFTMHTWSWKEPCFDVRVLPFNIWEEFNPMDGAALCRFLGTDDRNIVFCMAGYHTSLTSRAFIKVDHHSPLIQKTPPCPSPVPSPLDGRGMR